MHKVKKTENVFLLNTVSAFCDMAARSLYLSTELYFVTSQKSHIFMIANVWVSDRVLPSFFYADVISVVGTSRQTSDTSHLVEEHEQCVIWGLYDLLVEDESFLGCDASLG